MSQHRKGEEVAMNDEQREYWRANLHSLIDRIFDEAVTLDIDHGIEHDVGPFGPVPAGGQTLKLRWTPAPPGENPGPNELIGAAQHGPVPMAMWYVVCTFWPHRVLGPFDSRQDGEGHGEEEGCCILLKLEVDGRTLTAEEDAWV